MTQHVEQVNGKKSIVKVVLDIISGIVLVVLGVFIVYMLVFMFKGMKTNETPTIFGHQIYIVRSNSMSPTFETGSLLLVKHVDTSSIQVNDIITFKEKNDSVATTHRVVKILNDNGLQFVTRGDANNVDDPMPVSADEVVGRVVFWIPYIGYLLGFIRTKEGLLVFIIVPALIIIITQIISFIREVKKKEDKPSTEELQAQLQELLSNSRRED
ncbi:MAG TPA: signal peptidase I [Thermoclostridium sp.]